MKRLALCLLAALTFVACVDMPAEQPTPDREVIVSLGDRLGVIVESTSVRTAPLATSADLNVIQRECSVSLETCGNSQTLPTCSATNCSLELASDLCFELLHHFCNFP